MAHDDELDGPDIAKILSAVGDTTPSPLGEGLAHDDELDGADIAKILFAVLICIGIFPVLKWFFGVDWTNTLILGAAALVPPVLLSWSAAAVRSERGSNDLKAGACNSVLIALLPSLVICAVLKFFYGPELWLVFVPLGLYILFVIRLGIGHDIDADDILAIIFSMLLLAGVCPVIKWIFGVGWICGSIIVVSAMLILCICALTWSARELNTDFGVHLVMFTLLLGGVCLLVCAVLKWIFGLAWWIALIAFVLLAFFGMLFAVFI